MVRVSWSHGERWQYLNDWLLEHRELWKPAPFTQPGNGCNPVLPAPQSGPWNSGW